MGGRRNPAPLRQWHSMTTRPGSEARRRAGGATRIILADDYPTVRRSLRAALDACGCDVVGEAANGSEAVDLVVELEPDVVVMDIEMPVMDGIEATRRIKIDHPEVEVVLFTAQDRPAIDLALESGASNFYSKEQFSELVEDLTSLG